MAVTFTPGEGGGDQAGFALTQNLTVELTRNCYQYVTTPVAFGVPQTPRVASVLLATA